MIRPETKKTWKKKYRKFKTDFKRKYNKIKPELPGYADEAGLVVSAGSSYFLRNLGIDAYQQTKKAYLKNLANQQRIKGGAKLTPYQYKSLRKKMAKDFKIPDRVGKFGFYRKLTRGLKATYPIVRDKKISAKKIKYLNQQNLRSLRKIALKKTPMALLLSAGVFGTVPAIRSAQAKYSPGRKFKKEAKQNLSRGIVKPTLGYAMGKPLDDALSQMPYLRASKTVRKLEGKYHQRYGQGVQFYKGTSGLRAEDIQKLNRDIARRDELRRRAKRKRGK